MRSHPPSRDISGGTLRITDEWATRRYEGEARVGGVIASVGRRMIEVAVASKKIIQQFFDAAAAKLKESARK